MTTDENAERSGMFVRPGQALARLPGLWFGVSQPVTPAAYAVSGIALMLLKYGAEAWLIWRTSGERFMPWDFLNPTLTARQSLVQSGPEWLPWALFVWTLPFLWISVSMSVRRAADAGMSPWIGLLVLVPLLNLVFMMLLCFYPRRRQKRPPPGYEPLAADSDRGTSAAMAIGISVVFGGLMLFISVYLLETYGASLFLGTPLLMGSISAFLYNRLETRTFTASASIGLGSVTFASAALLLFALEGVICVAMAAPLILPIGALGGVLGKAIADSTRRPTHELFGVVLVLPVLAVCESAMIESPEYSVLTTVEVNAPAERVWANVIEFPDLPEARAWYFGLGIACPERARIEGRGPGAIRYCDFTTGSFIEPITVWDEPHRLAFDVTEQPPPMFELSPYRHVHPPHLDGYLLSTRGEFRLIPLPDGRTRLEGRTWYRFEMFPQRYWTLWSDLLIHRIHERVLEHIKTISEAQSTAPGKLGN